MNLAEPSPTHRAPWAPISEIRLRNFKSVANATVELRPLTLVVGRNSSGKSTLLQSVLALAQAVRDEADAGRFPLNGGLVRLGTFKEVRTFTASEGESVLIGFTVNGEPEGTQPMRWDRRGMPVSVRWEGHIGEPVDGLTSFAQLEALELELRVPDGSGGLSTISVDISHINGNASEYLDAVDVLGGAESVQLAVDGRLTDLRTGRSSRIDTMSASGGLPLGVFRTETRFELYAQTWWDVYEDTFRHDIREAKADWADGLSSGKTMRQTSLCLAAASSDVRRMHDAELSTVQTGRSYLGGRHHGDYEARYFYGQASSEPKQRRQRLARSMVSLGEVEFRKRLRTYLASEGWLDERVLAHVGDAVQREFADAARMAWERFRNVRYLGPLRESPQVLYNPSSADDLGTRGQYAASVLHARGGSTVLAPLPDGRVCETTLGQALDLWLAELRLAGGAQASDRGRLGMGLTVSPIGSSRPVDLTSVGVGVSQALPVVLACLLAAPGTVLVLEQPELHLHPAMQLRLADFLLACARSGRQLLVETHSEHLVNRLRFRVADDDSTATADLVRLLFAEQEDGVTSYRTSDVNELGGLSEDWPGGFLDVASDEAGRFLRQTLTKKRSLAERPG
jgi:energy-coupling factor transporter ATP-binding protein EcfA2